MSRFVNKVTEYKLTLTLVFLTILIWKISDLGYLKMSSNFLYDQMVRLTPQQRDSDRSTLLIEIAPKRVKDGDKYWLSIVEQLKKAGTKNIIFEFIPPKVTKIFYNKLSSFKQIIFNVDINKKKDGTGEMVQPPPPYQLAENIHFSPFSVPEAEYGIYRYQNVSVTIAGKDYQKAEVTAYNLITGKKLPFTGNTFWVNFNGFTGSFPTLSEEQVFSGQLIPETLNNRSVIIGIKKLLRSPGLHTPVQKKQAFSTLEYMGMSLDTLLRERIIQRSSSTVTSLILSVICIISIFSYQSTNHKLSIQITLFLLCAYLIAGWGMLSYANFFIPVAEILYLQVLCHYTAQVYRGIAEEHSGKELLIEVSSSVQSEYIPPGFYSLDDTWTLVLNMVHQILDLKRSIFLEKIEGDHRVREVKGLNLSFEDILENRRDFERPPYSRVISEKKAVVVENYLRNSPENEIQYLSPLTFAGQIWGFWAFGVDPMVKNKIKAFDSIIANFSFQIGEMLFRREEWQKKNLKKNRGVMRYFETGGGNNLIELRKKFALLEKQKIVLEAVFSSINSAATFYDLFGRVLQVNKKMITLLGGAQADPSKMTAADLISTVTGLTSLQTREALREVIIQRKSVSLFTTIRKKSDSHLLTIKPVTDFKKIPNTDDAMPFQVLGIMIEISLLSNLLRKTKLKDDLAKKMIKQTYTAISQIQQSGRHSTTDGQQQGIYRKCCEEILAGLHGTVDFLRKTEKYLSVNLFENKEHLYPVESALFLKNVTEALQDEASQKNIVFDCSINDEISLVCVDPEKMEYVFLEIVKMLVTDAIPDSMIVIRITQEQESIVYRFNNKGYGLSNDVLKKHLYQEEDSHSHRYNTLREVITCLKKWGGTFEARSEIGEGFYFTFRLPIVFDTPE